MRYRTGKDATWRKIVPFVIATCAGLGLSITRAPMWAAYVTVAVVAPVGCWIRFGPFRRIP